MKNKLKADKIAQSRGAGLKSNNSGRPKLSEGRKEGKFCYKVAAEKVAKKGHGVIGL